MKIGELSRLTSTKVETVRFYEKSGLLPAPVRTAANYRDYGIDHLKRLRFVRKARSLGFSLDEVRELLRLAAIGREDCASVHALTEAHLSAVDRKIADLERMRGTLVEIGQGCAGGNAPACIILDALADE